HLGAVGQEQDFGDLLRAIAALLRLVLQPLEQCAIALEGRVDALVERAVEFSALVASQRIECTDRCDLRVFRLLSRSPSRPRVRAALCAPSVVSVAGLRSARPRSSGLFLARDRRSAFAVDFDDEDETRMSPSSSGAGACS